LVSQCCYSDVTVVFQLCSFELVRSVVVVEP
jgi:hypothetical protein